MFSDNIIYIGGAKKWQNFYSTVEFKSVNNNKTCPIQSLHHELAEHASVVTSIGVITCGGESPNFIRRNECIRLTDKNTWDPFPSIPSVKEGGVVHDMVVVGDVLVALVFIGYGGFDYLIEKINWRNGETWQSNKINRRFFQPCITAWDDENIFIIGGFNKRFDKRSKIKNETWILNIATNTMKQGPSLNIARVHHGCANIRNDSIIVAGGFPLYESTEILKIGDLEWKRGPDLKEGVTANKVVKSNLEDYVAYSIGGNNWYGTSLSEIYGLQRDMNEWQLIDNMNEPRMWGTALNIPSSLIPWC